MTNVTPVRPSRDVCLWRRPAPSWDDGIAKEGSDYDNRQQSFRTRLAFGGRKQSHYFSELLPSYFSETLADWRDYSKCHSIYDLIWKIYNDRFY